MLQKVIGFGGANAVVPCRCMAGDGTMRA